MFTSSLSLLALGAIAFSTAQAQGVGNAAAVAACAGFPAGALKCLTDVSYVVCRGPGGYEVEQFVAAGTHCEQGIPYQRLDAVDVAGDATTTRSFVQNPPDPSTLLSSIMSAAPTSSTAPSSSAPASSADTTSPPPPPPPSSSAPPPPPPLSSATVNTVDPVNTAMSTSAATA